MENYKEEATEILKTKIVPTNWEIFEGCQNLVADNIIDAEHEYSTMFRKYIKDHNLEDQLEFVAVIENDGTYDLIVKRSNVG